MKIVIAEDEKLEREAMKKFLVENFPGVTVVGEAVNGRSAIQLAKQVQPDVMLIDIKMPGINGIEAIEEISRFNSSIKFILVSAYDSFDYAKHAMKLGVKEYILKPSKKEETISAIKRITAELEADREIFEHQQHSTNIAKQHFLSKLMQYEISQDTAALKSDLFPFMKCGFFLVIKGLRDEDISTIEVVVQKQTADAFIFQRQEQQLVILFIAEENRTKADILKFVRRMHLEIDPNSYVGAGYPYVKVEDLPKSYHQAITAVDYYFTNKSTNYGFPSLDDSSLKDRLDRLLFEINAGNEQGALHYFSHFNENSTQTERHNLFQELYYKTKQNLENKDITPPNKPFVQLQSEEDWGTFIKLCCLNVQQHYQSQHKIERAKRFIHKHYDQSITLEEVAAYVALSTNYFSNLFKEATGETFIDYLTKIRLKQAKKFIQAHTYSLKEISFMVGYKDPNYFSRVFKKYFAISPKQYQQEIFKK